PQNYGGNEVSSVSSNVGRGFRGSDGPSEGGPSARTVSSDTPEVSSGAYIVVTDPAGLAMVAVAVGESELVGMDTETTGPGPHTGRVRLLSLATDRGTFLVDCFAVDPSPLFEHLAERPLVLHNGLFDLQFLGRLGFTPGADVRDTLLLSQVLYAGDRA